MGVFFSDQGEAAVCARVAIALVKLERRRRAPDELKPGILIGCAVERLKGLQLHTVRLALLSLAVWVFQGRRSDAWLKGVLMRDYYGFSIRRCYYAEYKGNRGDDPRVTNRGVMHQLPLPDGAGFSKYTENEPGTQ
jgi:hypothetical protein